MALTKQQRLAMIDFLVPLLNDEGKRQMHMDLLFAGESRRPDLNLHGAPRETTTRIVLALESYSIEPNKPALVDLLQQISYDVGVDQQAQIEEWKKALLTSVSQPSSPTTPQSPVLQQTPTIESPVRNAAPSLPQQRPAISTSRAESFTMSAPFAWITIPAGKVTLEAKNESYLKTETTFDLIPFGLSKYPITVGQYKKFFDAGGYRDRAVWTKAGWKWLAQSRDQVFDIKSTSGDTYPAVVTWYEAMAFCTWLSLMTDQRVSLPSEHQWQRAAQGDDGRLYPWVHDWDANRCNNSVGGVKSKGLTPVDKYELEGHSWHNVVDMVGNAAEWTLTNWRTGEQGGDGEDPRVVRGGSYENQHLNFYRVTTRHKEWPTAHCGFRLMHLVE